MQLDGRQAAGIADDMLHQPPSQPQSPAGRGNHHVFNSTLEPQRMPGEAQRGAAHDVPAFHGRKKVRLRGLRRSPEHLRRYGNGIVQHGHQPQYIGHLGVCKGCQFFDFHSTKIIILP